MNHVTAYFKGNSMTIASHGLFQVCHRQECHYLAVYTQNSILKCLNSLLLLISTTVHLTWCLGHCK